MLKSCLCLEMKKREKNMKLPSEPILFCPTSLTRTSCWNDDFPRGLDHSMSLLLERYIFLKVSHVTFYSESRVLMKIKRKSRHLRRWRWRPDLVKSRLQTVKNSTRTHTFPVSSPLIPQSLSPTHLPEATAVAREQAASPIGSHRLQSCCLLRLDKCVWFLKPAISVT